MPPARFARVPLRPNAPCVLSPNPPLRNACLNLKLRSAFLDLLRWFLLFVLDAWRHWGWLLAPLDEHKQNREHEAASEAETESESERKGERIARVAHVRVVEGRERWC